MVVIGEGPAAFCEEFLRSGHVRGISIEVETKAVADPPWAEEQGWLALKFAS